MRTCWSWRSGSSAMAFRRRPGAGVSALAHGERHRDVPQRQESRLKRVTRASPEVRIPKGLRVRRLHKAFLALPRRPPTTGRCCARRCGAWAQRSDRQVAAISCCPANQPPGTGELGSGRRPAVSNPAHRIAADAGQTPPFALMPMQSLPATLLYAGSGVARVGHDHRCARRACAQGASEHRSL